MIVRGPVDTGSPDTWAQGSETLPVTEDLLLLLTVILTVPGFGPMEDMDDIETWDCGSHSSLVSDTELMVSGHACVVDVSIDESAKAFSLETVSTAEHFFLKGEMELGLITSVSVNRAKSGVERMIWFQRLFVMTEQRRYNSYQKDIYAILPTHVINNFIENEYT